MGVTRRSLRTLGDTLQRVRDGPNTTRNPREPLSTERAAKAESRFLKRIRNAPGRGTGGAIRWTRDEVHQRGLR